MVHCPVLYPPVHEQRHGMNIYIYIKCSLGDQACYWSILDPEEFVLVCLEKPCYGIVVLDVPKGKGFARLGAVSWSRGPSRLDGPSVLICTLRAS